MRSAAADQTTSSNVKMEFISNEEDSSSDQLRRGPWTLEEDTLLTHYISRHGEGRWNMLAKCAGLKRTGKSCRLRWLNYLKPDIKRGNLTPQEQLLILELHSKWGNRWSKIAQHLPGRTDNEIKNYWRTRVQKQARQLNIESDSKRFLDAVRCFWMPRLIQKMEQTSSSSSSSTKIELSFPSSHQSSSSFPNFPSDNSSSIASSSISSPKIMTENSNHQIEDSNLSSVQSDEQFLQQYLGCQQFDYSNVYGNNYSQVGEEGNNYYEMEQGYAMSAATGNYEVLAPTECQMADGGWVIDDDMADAFWNMDDIWQFRE